MFKNYKNFFRVIFVLTILIEIAGWLGAFPPPPDFTWIGLIVTAAFGWVMVEIFNFSALVWTATFLMVIWDGVSALYGLYSKIEPWDKYVHAGGGALLGMASLELTRRVLARGWVQAKKEKLFIWMSVLGGVTFIGFLYEFWEYLVDKIQYGYPKSLVSAYDSVEDQVFNILGGILVLLIFFWLEKRRKKLNQ